MRLSKGQAIRQRAAHIVAANARTYCETTTLHGFVYWVTAPRHLEKFFWVIIVLIGFVCASVIVSAAIDDWKKNPGIVTINSFSKVHAQYGEIK
jgi:hypothetical protein